MAEIHIQKKRPPVWPWILIIVVVIAAVWLIIDNSRENDEVISGGVRDDFREENPTSPDTFYAAAIVNEYILFINDEQPPDNAESEEFIKEGVKRLSRAISAIADEKFMRDVEINNKADFIQQKTDSLEKISGNSNEIKQLFASTVEVMNSMQQKDNQNIEDEISKVKSSADKIRANRPVIKQQQEIIVFLKESGDVLQLMTADENINNRRY